MARRKRTDGPTRAQHEDALRRRARLPEGLQAFAGDADTPEQLAEWINRSLATAARFKASGGRYNAPKFIQSALHDLTIFALTRPELRPAAEQGIADFQRLLALCEESTTPAEQEEQPVAWSQWDSPKVLAQKLGLSNARAFTRLCKVGKIRFEQLDSKTYRIDASLLPAGD